jgi:hypothetical protein
MPGFQLKAHFLLVGCWCPAGSQRLAGAPESRIAAGTLVCNISMRGIKAKIPGAVMAGNLCRLCMNGILSGIVLI